MIGSWREAPANVMGHEGVHSVYLSDLEEPVEIADREATRITQQTEIIPAEPGWRVLHVYGAGDDRRTWTTPILAWGLGGGQIAAAITPGGKFDGPSDTSLFLSPTDTVVCPYEGSWDSLDDYLEYLVAEAARAKSCAPFVLKSEGK
jgi:hypothetical protein